MSAEFEFRYQGIFQDWRMSSYMISGGFFEHDRNILRLHDACMRRGLGFYIDALFGGQPCAWHAGRIVRKVMDDAALERHMHEYLDAYTERGIAVRLTMSNPHITPEELRDARSNLMLDILAEHDAGRGLHGVILSSDILRDYIRNRYPSLRLTASVIKTAYAHPAFTDDQAWYEELAERYDLVVLRSDRVIQRDWLAKLRKKDRMELMLSSGCVLNCPMRVRHYDLILETDRSSGDKPGSEELRKLVQTCMHRRRNEATIHVNTDDLRELHDLGFSHFKIPSRTMDWVRWLNATAKYIVQPGKLLEHYFGLSNW